MGTEPTPEEVTRRWMKKIEQILAYTPPETLTVKLCRFMIDEWQDLTNEDRDWLVKWLKVRGADDLAALVEDGKHWDWARKERCK